MLIFSVQCLYIWLTVFLKINSYVEIVTLKNGIDGCKKENYYVTVSYSGVQNLYYNFGLQE